VTYKLWHQDSWYQSWCR